MTTAVITAADPSKTRRIELILRQIETLPTLPAVAMRLLQLTASDESHAREVIETVSSDQALTAKILSMCQRADLGVRHETTTIDKAVLLLGFNAVRNAVLSVKVLEVFAGPATAAARREDATSDPPPAEAGANTRTGDGDQPGAADAAGAVLGLTQFDRTGFWRHCLAVAIAAELIAQAHPGQPDLPAGEAFVCGLLHDIGKLALDSVLPKSYARVAELVELNQGNIAEFERRVVGIDHHTAGKRLAEQWQLPHMLQDCIWLHGSAFDALPNVPHRRLIGLVSLADLVVRQRYVGYSGNFTFKQNADQLARQLGLDPQLVAKAADGIHGELERRERMLGLSDQPSTELYLESIQRANEMLGRLNGALERRSRAAARQAQVLEAITAFHNGAAPGRGVQDVLGAVVASAAKVLGQGYYATLHQVDRGDPWLVCQVNSEGRVVHSQYVDPPPGAEDLVSIDATQPSPFSVVNILPWITDYLAGADDVRNIRLLPLGCGWGTAAMLVHDRPALPPWQQLSALTSTWGAAVAGADQHDGARRIGEQLVEANRALAQTQDKLLHAESMARVGEMAAGAAHEMNNPLAVISGRSQLLTSRLKTGTEEHKAAQIVEEQAHRLSDLISSLRLYADPPQPQRQHTDLATLLNATSHRLLEEHPEIKTPVYVQLKEDLPMVDIDPDMIAQAVTELLINALHAAPRTSVQVYGRVNTAEGVVQIQVGDDGQGMDAHTLAHAMDPFFSAKSAGRRVGMGLPRAQQLVAAHLGRVELRSAPGEGTVATLSIPLDPTP